MKHWRLRRRHPDHMSAGQKAVLIVGVIVLGVVLVIGVMAGIVSDYCHAGSYCGGNAGTW